MLEPKKKGCDGFDLLDNPYLKAVFPFLVLYKAENMGLEGIPRIDRRCDFRLTNK